MTRRSYFQRRWNLGRRQYTINGRRAKGPLKGTSSANILSPGTYGGSTTQGQPSTYGLNAANQELAELGVPIPVLFGKRRNENGGFIATPLLIYQRMYSKGAYEEARIGFVCGEGALELEKPSMRGIRIGKDLLHSKQTEFYEIRFTDGSTADNDPKTANTDPWGAKMTNATTNSEDKFFCIRDPSSEIRGLSQSFDPGVSFGLESEQPDCTQSYDSEFTSLIPIPDPSETPLIKYSPVDASVGNTRGCRTTEFGFAVNMPQPAPVAQEQTGSGIIPVGSKWTYRKQPISPGALRLCWDNGQVDPVSGLPLITGVVDYHNEGFKAEVISADSAFYALYRPFYKTESQQDIAKIYSTFLSQFGGYTFYFDPKNVPSPIWGMVTSRFSVDTPGNSYFERQDGQFADTNFKNLDPCEFGYFDPSTLLDSRVPKMFFRLYYRKLDDNSADWKLLHKQQFCFLSPDASRLFASLKVHHPGLDEQAYEYRFKAQTPLQAETDTQAVYEKCKYGVKASGGGATLQDVCILYPGTGQREQNVTAEDGFRLTFDGLIEPVQSEIKLDVQSESFDVQISYVNEFVRDPDPRYPYMSVGMLEVRAGKGFSTLDQLSFYYSDGAEITRVDGEKGSSYKFPDLCYYLLTQYPGNGPGPVARDQVDVASFTKANTFTDSKNLRYNGVITDRVGIHEFISEHAKYFLLRFGTSNGRYTLFSAINDAVTDTPTASASQVVTLDMIDDSSFSVDYATLAQREDAKMHVIYREQDRNMPGINRSVTVQPVGYTGANKVTHDISGFCTSKEHALAVARFLSAMRSKQDRVVQFTCVENGVDLGPGRLFKFDIKVETSRGHTYTNTDQYQVTSRTYRDDGTLDVRAVLMPAGITDMVFDDREFEEVN